MELLKDLIVRKSSFEDGCQICQTCAKEKALTTTEFV